MILTNCECGWVLPEPGLPEAVFGRITCPNCGIDTPLSEEHQREILEDIDLKINNGREL